MRLRSIGPLVAMLLSLVACSGDDDASPSTPPAAGAGGPQAGAAGQAGASAAGAAGAPGGGAGADGGAAGGAAAGGGQADAPAFVEASFDAGLDEPLLLTVAAARERSRYLIDEGYTYTPSEEAALSFVTDTGGDLVLAFSVDGATTMSLAALSPRVVHTASDVVVVQAALSSELRVQVLFAAVSSDVARATVTVQNDGAAPHDIEVVGALRRCRDGYEGLAPRAGGVAERHRAKPDGLLSVIAPTTHVQDLAGVLLSPGGVVLGGLESCNEGPAADVEALLSAKGALPAEGQVIGVASKIAVAPGARRAVSFFRAVSAEADEQGLEAAVEMQSKVSLDDLVAQGKQRLAAMPTAPDGVMHPLAYRSSFVLLDQLMMPAEGLRKHDYYLFSREPTWWFARLGQHIHESMGMMLMAHLSARDAHESQRNFFERVEADGYLPYNIGPLVEQTTGGTASAPLLAFVSWDIAQTTGDDAFVAEAYEAASKTYRFWLEQRDKDGDGLAEWGGIPITESLRDLENVIWTEVASPDTVEAVDLNSMLVVEARALASMADKLGRGDEAAAYRQQADARAALINERMYDEAAGFYFHNAIDGGFSAKKPDDLKRLEIAGFMPLWAGIVPEGRVASLVARLNDPATFGLPFGVPGLAANDPFFSAESSQCCEWNGPVWVPWQLFITRGLRAAGEGALADEISRRTISAVEAQLRTTHQFREHYDPADQTSNNRSMPNYVWSALGALLALEVGK